MTTPKAEKEKQKKRDIRSLVQAPATQEQIALVLPKYLTPDRLLRVALTTINRNPKLLECTPESLLSGLMLCAQVGLEPDGRLAHLIPYGDQCSVIFDWKGLVELCRRNGVSIVPKLVCRNDFFSVLEDDGEGKTKVTHRIDFTKPRGEVVLAYTRAKNDSGEFDYEFMTRDQIEGIRQNFSKAKEAEAWKKSWDEMAKKTVIRRHSKRLPLTTEVAAAFDPTAEENPSQALMRTTRPIFESRSTVEVPPKEESDDDGDLGPQKSSPTQQPSSSESGQAAPTQPEPPPAQPKENKTARMLKAVSFLCKSKGHAEADLVTFLVRSGRADESLTSLEQIAEMKPSAIAWAHDNWRSVDEELERAKK